MGGNYTELARHQRYAISGSTERLIQAGEITEDEAKQMMLIQAEVDNMVEERRNSSRASQEDSNYANGMDYHHDEVMAEDDYGSNAYESNAYESNAYDDSNSYSYSYGNEYRYQQEYDEEAEEVEDQRQQQRRQQQQQHRYRDHGYDDEYDEEYENKLD